MRVRRPQLEKRMYKAASVGFPHSVRLNSPEKVLLASRSLHFSRKKPFGGPKGFLRRKSPSFLATADNVQYFAGDVRCESRVRPIPRSAKNLGFVNPIWRFCLSDGALVTGS
jgi:hypothetical protein